MQQNVKQRLASAFETEELKGFARSVTELHWLLVILVLLYFFIPTREITNSDALIVSLVCYSAFIIAFRYLNPLRRETRWKLAMETWAMIGFISATLWHTGLVESPLLNLYLLVIIACAIYTRMADDLAGGRPDSLLLSAHGLPSPRHGTVCT